MKKILIILLTMLIFSTCLTACTNPVPEDTDIIVADEITETENVSGKVDFFYDETILVTMYCDGDWDGSFIYNDQHCASIRNGELWFDCQISTSIPDMGPNEDCFWAQVIGTSEFGTWIYDRKLGTIELWQNGTRYKKIILDFDETVYTDVYVLSDCIISRNDTNVSVYDLDGNNINNFYNIIDCYQENIDTVLLSTFDHKNFSINSIGREKELKSNFVRFPRENVQIEEVDSQILTQVFNLYYATEWYGDFKIINDSDFIYVDFYGDIFINNELAGNICLGAKHKITNTGVNLSSSIDRFLYLNGEELMIFKKGDEKRIDIPDGTGKIVWDGRDLGTIILIYGTAPNENCLIIVRDDEVTVLSDKVSDCNVAYDSLYFMEGDKVYSLNWMDDKSEPKLFFEGAYAVSQRTDELEGAIVSSKDNNMESYGAHNLYSPYGEDK